jgi:hypothetical protein
MRVSWLVTYNKIGSGIRKERFYCFYRMKQRFEELQKAKEITELTWKKEEK